MKNFMTLFGRLALLRAFIVGNAFALLNIFYVLSKFNSLEFFTIGTVPVM